MEIAILLHSTFNRLENLKKTVESFGYDYKIYLAWTGELNGEVMSYLDLLNSEGHEAYYLGWDTSPAVTRNYLIEKITEPYIWKIDDDFILTGDEKPGDIIEVLKKEGRRLALVGMSVAGDKRVSPFIYNANFVDKRLKLESVKNPEWKKVGNVNYHYCDITPDCWIARREIFPECNYDMRFHVSEGLHPDFFLQIKKKGYKVAYTPDSVVYHTKWQKGNKINKDSFYNQMRFRNLHNTNKFCEKWEITGTNII